MQLSICSCAIEVSGERQGLNATQEQGASELVLDLRDNRGGLVSEGVEVARLFLDGALRRLSQMSAQCPQCGTPRSREACTLQDQTLPSGSCSVSSKQALTDPGCSIVNRKWEQPSLSTRLLCLSAQPERGWW